MFLESARSGALPSLQLGRYRHVDLDEVDRWLEKCKRGGQPVRLRRDIAMSGGALAAGPKRKAIERE
jgi:hypothetical protein